MSCELCLASGELLPAPGPWTDLAVETCSKGGDYPTHELKLSGLLGAGRLPVDPLCCVAGAASIND